MLLQIVAFGSMVLVLEHGTMVPIKMGALGPMSEAVTLGTIGKVIQAQ